MRDIIDRSATELSDWIFLVCGLTLLAMALITPNWIACKRLAGQRDLMALQLQRFEEQHSRYDAFHAALLADDPVLLERLAFTQFGYKPKGKELLDSTPTSVFGFASPGAPTAGQLALSASVDPWLLEPMPRLGIDWKPPPTIDSRLTRLTTQGSTRLGLMVAGVICLAAGLWPRERSAD